MFVKNTILELDEVFFVIRFVYESLRVDEPASRLTHGFLQRLGLEERSMANFLNVMAAEGYAMLYRVVDGFEPAEVHYCPWENIEQFHTRDMEMQKWLADRPDAQSAPEAIHDLTSGKFVNGQSPPTDS